MPKTVPINGFFSYLRHQAVSAARSARGSSGASSVPVPPLGYGFVLNDQGGYVLNDQAGRVLAESA